jgi:hypothetical protein
MDRIDLPAQCLGNFVLGVHAHGLDDDDDLLIRI